MEGSRPGRGSRSLEAKGDGDGLEGIGEAGVIGLGSIGVERRDSGADAGQGLMSGMEDARDIVRAPEIHKRPQRERIHFTRWSQAERARLGDGRGVGMDKGWR